MGGERKIENLNHSRLQKRFHERAGFRSSPNPASPNPATNHSRGQHLDQNGRRLDARHNSDRAVERAGKRLVRRQGRRGRGRRGRRGHGRGSDRRLRGRGTVTRRSNTRVVDTQAQFGGTVGVCLARHKVRRPHRRKLGRPSKIRRELKVGAVNSFGLTTRKHGRSRVWYAVKICLARIGRPPPAGRRNPLSEIIERDLSSGYVGRKICTSRRIGATKQTFQRGSNTLV